MGWVWFLIGYCFFSFSLLYRSSFLIFNLDKLKNLLVFVFHDFDFGNRKLEIGNGRFFDDRGIYFEKIVCCCFSYFRISLRKE